MKNYNELGIYDFSDYAEEITGDALFKINGGAEVQNSHQGVDNANVRTVGYIRNSNFHCFIFYFKF